MIKNKMKIILKLSSIFLKDSYSNINIFNKDSKKINKKSIYLWMMIILFLALFFASQKIIKILIDKELIDSFLNIYFFILAILIIFQTSLVIINVFYFSKDLEYILPLPLRPTEILISKFISLMCSTYFFEIIFGIIPITIFGIYNNSPLLFYFYEIIVFIIFPIFLSSIVSIIMMFFMKLSKFIKNKDIFQIIITFFIISLMVLSQYLILNNILKNNINIENTNENSISTNIIENNKISEISNYFLVINPSINILKKSNWSSLIEIIKLILIDLISIIIFIFIGKKTYLKDILINTTYIKTSQFNKKRWKNNNKKRKKHYSYIIKEFKTLYRNPLLFIQCIFPIFTFTISLSILIINIVPQFRIWMQNEEFRNFIGEIPSFDITAVYIILGILQFFFMVSTTSLIAVSREGKKAYFMKYIPISLYSQFCYKGIPQILINLIPITVVIYVIHIMIPEILTEYIIEIFILALLLNIINSYSMLIIDFLNPKLNWDTEYEVLKQNKNKIFQYVFTVLIILFFIYLGNVLIKINIQYAVLITGIIFLVYILIINILVKAYSKKIFSKIN